MLYGTDVRVSLTHFKKILSIGFLLFYKMSKINMKKNPFDKIFRKNHILSTRAMVIDEQNFKKIHRRKRAKFTV